MSVVCVCVLLQQQYGYQEEEERSLNSLDDNRALPFHPSSYRSRSRGSPLDRDRQLLQDLVSFYLTSPSSSSSSSSSPVQSLPRHRGAVAAAAAGLPSSLSSSSSSSFFPELDFPLDYGEDYVSQVAQQEPAEKKAQDEYDALSELDGERDEKRRQVTISFVHRVYFLCIPFLNIVCLSAQFLLFFFLFQGNVCKFLQFFFISHPFIGLSILLFHPSNSLSSSEPVSVVIGREAGYILHRSRGCLGAIHYLTYIYYNVTKEGQNFALVKCTRGKN